MLAPAKRIPLTNDEANELLALAKYLRPGERMIYHTGYLAKDRCDDGALAWLAAELLGLAAAGRLRLYQRGFGAQGVYQYIAEGR